MFAISCSACQKKLSVKEELAGKKVKCPACGHITAIAAQPAVVRNGGPPDAAADLPTNPPHPADPSATPTLPSSSNREPTQGVKPDAGHDSALTDFLAPPQADDELGRLGKYRILKILGHGGMGVVFLGEDPKLGRKVAIKAMLPHLAGSKSSQQRFMREAHLAATLEHDHIVPIFQVDEDRGAPYIVMPFLKGEPLDERLRHGDKIPLEDILRIGREIAEALSAAHALGLVHRDIKPANVWLEQTSRARQEAGQTGSLPDGRGSLGRVKILDFGLARSTTDEAHLTQSGAIVGTPAYMAPEQCRGETLDGRCDLWSLGVVLYRMCTGVLPFRGNDTLSTMRALEMTDPPPPVQVDAEIPVDLSNLVMKLLEKDAAKRVASADQVVQALQAQETELIRKREARENTVPVAAPIIRKTALDRRLFAVDEPPPAGSETMDGEPSPVRGRLSPPASVSLTGPSRGSARRIVLFAAFAFLALLGAGGIYYWQTNNGTVRIEINDPDIKVAFDKNGPIISGVDQKDIKLTPGEFGLRVERGDLKFDTDKFILKRGETITLKIEWLKDGKLQVVQGERVIGAKELPMSAVAVVPPGVGDKGNKVIVAIPEAGWTQLFNGKDLAGWKTHPAAPGLWKVADGLLTCTGPESYLFTERSNFKDFHCRLEMRLNEAGNSGLFIRYPFDAPFSRGYEVQLTNLGSERFGGLYRFPGTKNARYGKGWGKGPRLPADAWLTLDVIAAGKHLTTKVNGDTVLDFEDAEGHTAAGHLALQHADQKTAAYFRKIEIKSLKAGGTPIAPATPKEGPTKPTPPATSEGPADPERKAAESLIPFADLTLDLKSGKRTLFRSGAKLPSEPFKVTAIAFSRAYNKDLPATFVGATLLPAIAELKSLTAIWNHFDQVETVTGEELARLSKMPAAKTINILWLRFQLTSDAVDSLARFSNLGSLNCLAERTDGATLSRLKELPNLKQLHLLRLGKAGPISDKGIDDLCSLELTSIQVSSSTIVDARFAGKLANMPSVEHIGLSWIDDEIMAVIARGTAQLIKLDVTTSRGVTDAGLAHLKAKTTLRVLRVSFTNVTEAGARKLSDALPKCKIELGGGKVIGPKDKTAPPPVDPDGTTPEASLPPLDPAWLKAVAAMEPEQQIEAVKAELMKRNPGFDGEIKRQIKAGVVAAVTFSVDNVIDIAPIRALTGLQSLTCNVSAGRKGPLADLSPLEGMGLTYLSFVGTQVADLSPLKGMKLTYLGCNVTKVADLSPLKGMPLTYLHCSFTPVADLSPLKDMKLTNLTCSSTKITDLTPLKGMPLTILWISRTPVADLSPLKGMRLTSLACDNTKVADFSPMKEMPLKALDCDFQAERDAAILRSIPTLETINGKDAKQFWQEVDKK